MHITSSDAVYVLDVAGQNPWEKCANLREPREEFGCGVLNGKIYVFGGMSMSNPVSGSEVYDPKINFWSTTSPMKSFRFSHRVDVVGEELVLHGGWIMGHYLDNAYESECLEAYHPGENAWRVADLRMNPQRVSFAAKDKFYSVGQVTIHTLDIGNGDSWKLFPPYLFGDAVGGALDRHSIMPCAALGVDDEILAIVSVQDNLEDTVEYRPVQTSGFQDRNRGTDWQTVEFPLVSRDLLRFELHGSMQL
ncbi:unnamed protein product [Calypogeia fissa]